PPRMTCGSVTFGLSHSSPSKQLTLHDKRHEQVVVAVLIEEDGHLVAVVPLDGALAEAVTRDALADRERLGRGLRRARLAVVVAVLAGPGIVLAEVGEQERAPTAGVLGVAAHHLEPGALDLVLARGLHVRRRQHGRDVEGAGPANLAVRIP